MVSLLGELKTGQESMCVCVCVSVFDFKVCNCAPVCQRELASIFLSQLCIALSDLSASAAHRSVQKKLFQNRCMKRERRRGGAEEMQWAKYHSTTG